MYSSERNQDSDRSEGETEAQDRDHEDSLATPLLAGTDWIDYDPVTDAFRTQFDHEVDPPSHLIVHAVAAVEDRDVVGLDPLYDSLDPEALDRLFASLAGSDRGGGARLQFSFHGQDVVLHDNGILEIAPRERSKAMSRP